MHLLLLQLLLLYVALHVCNHRAFNRIYIHYIRYYFATFPFHYKVLQWSQHLCTQVNHISMLCSNWPQHVYWMECLLTTMNSKARINTHMATQCRYYNYLVIPSSSGLRRLCL